MVIPEGGLVISEGHRLREGLIFGGACEKVKDAQLCPTLHDPMDYIDHGILQAIILEWVAVAFSRRSSQLRDRTQVSHIAGGFFTS